MSELAITLGSNPEGVGALRKFDRNVPSFQFQRESALGILADKKDTLLLTFRPKGTPCEAVFPDLSNLHINSKISLTFSVIFHIQM